MSIQKRTWEILEPSKNGDRASSLFDWLLLSLIFLNVIAVIVGSVSRIQSLYGSFFTSFEIFSVFVFTGEYLTRIWSATTDPRYARPIMGRIKLMLSPMVLVDLLAILPFYIVAIGFDLRFIRAFRMLRLIRVFKLGRYFEALNFIGRVMKQKKEELVLTLGFLTLLLVMASCLMYAIENALQPDAFSSIPATMWWAVATLTTVGYGDIYPITTGGKVLGSLVAILGIGLFALPAGILGSGFIEEIQKTKQKGARCPHCDAEILLPK